MSKKRENIHKMNYVNEYLGHFAVYPDEFVGIVDRPTNFCLQFSPSIAVYRKVPGVEGELELHKDVFGTKNIRLCTNGTAFDTLAVRITRNMSEKVIKELILAHKQAKNDKFVKEMINLLTS